MEISLLTDDLLLKILEKIRQKDDQRSFRLVCKRFLRIESQLRKSLRVLRIEHLRSLLHTYLSLIHLDLSDCPCIDDRSLSYAFSNPVSTQMLKSLVLCRSTRLSFAGLRFVVRACPNLEEIDVSYCCEFGDMEVAALSCASRMKVLKLVKCLGVTDVGLAKIAIGCNRLENLSLKWCLKITDLGIELLAKKCRELKFLDVSYLRVSDRSLQWISTLQNLKVLIAAGCSFISDDGLHFLGNGSGSFKTVDVSRCSRVSSSGISSIIKGHGDIQELIASYIHELSIPFISKLKELSQLQRVRLDGLHVSDLILQLIGLNCKGLVEIGLSKCRGVTDTGIIFLLSNCINLETLDLTCCHLLTDVALTAVKDSCKNITCLKLESCHLITEIGISKLGTCFALKEIDLTDCNTNDLGMRALSKCVKLTDLKLGLCTDISDIELSHVSNLINLQQLDLYRCSRVRDEGLAFIANGCKKLKNLNISYCTLISDEGLKLLSSLRALCKLEMRRLVKISDVGLSSIATGCSNLTKLDVKRCYSIGDMGLCAIAYHCKNLRQINISYSAITDTGLFFLLGNLKCLQAAKFLHLSHVSLRGLELALKASPSLKKVKLVYGIVSSLSLDLIQILDAKKCKIKSVDKEMELI